MNSFGFTAEDGSFGFRKPTLVQYRAAVRSLRRTNAIAESGGEWLFVPAPTDTRTPVPTNHLVALCLSLSLVLPATRARGRFLRRAAAWMHALTEAVAVHWDVYYLLALMYVGSLFPVDLASTPLLQELVDRAPAPVAASSAFRLLRVRHLRTSNAAALRLLTSIVAEHPLHFAALYELGSLLFDMAKQTPSKPARAQLLERSIAYLSQAALIDPTHHELLTCLAYACSVDQTDTSFVASTFRHVYERARSLRQQPSASCLVALAGTMLDENPQCERVYKEGLAHLREARRVEPLTNDVALALVLHLLSVPAAMADRDPELLARHCAESRAICMALLEGDGGKHRQRLSAQERRLASSYLEASQLASPHLRVAEFRSSPASSAMGMQVSARHIPYCEGTDASTGTRCTRSGVLQCPCRHASARYCSRACQISHRAHRVQCPLQKKKEKK